jgi:prepilin signal peptidase PulO-like enzyme (type II secretory pathway)
MVRWLVAIGLVLVFVGLLWPLLSKIGLGRLPGDIVIERGNVRFYFPIATCLIISLVLSFFLWLLNR